jgi:hypothetical protein
MDCPCFTRRIRCTPSILLPPSVFPYSRFWLLRYTSHLLLPGLPLGGYQLFRDDVLHYRILRTILGP